MRIALTVRPKLNLCSSEILTELRFFNVLNGVQAIERLERLQQAQAKIVLFFVKDRDAAVAAVNDVVGVPALLSSSYPRHRAL